MGKIQNGFPPVDSLGYRKVTTKGANELDKKIGMFSWKVNGKVNFLEIPVEASWQPSEVVRCDLGWNGPPEISFTICLLIDENFLTICTREGSAPRSNPLPFYIPFWQKKYHFRIPFIEKGTPFINLHNTTYT